MRIMMARTVEEGVFLACWNGELKLAHDLQQNLSDADCARLRQTAQNILAFVRVPRPQRCDSTPTASPMTVTT
jgi:hypothetical protein